MIDYEVYLMDKIPPMVKLSDELAYFIYKTYS